MRRSAQSTRDYKVLTQSEMENALNFEVLETPSLYLDQYGTLQKYESRKTLYRSDNGTAVGVVGKNFDYIKRPKEHLLEVLGNLNDSGINYQPKHLEFVQGGAAINVMVDLPDFQLFKGTEEHQIAQLNITTRFDAKGADKLGLGAVRQVCTNGMVAFMLDFFMRLYHKGDLSQKVADALTMYQDFDKVWRYNEETITRLGEQNAKKDDVIAYIGDGEITNQPIFAGDRWAKRINEEWQNAGEPVNLWQLYNLFTYIISHMYGHQYHAKLQRMELLNREVKNWSKRFKTQEVF